MAKTGSVRIGISGWRYAGWRGVFYPPKLAQRHELAWNCHPEERKNLS